MNRLELLNGWKTILSGRAPFLSIEITRECPLTCPGCYAYGEEHLTGGMLLRQLSDFKGAELVRRVIGLADEYKPNHVSIVGGEPLVRYRELDEILPQLSSRGIHIQVVTSAVRPIPKLWGQIRPMDLCVSIDGLQPEHDKRRKPATYDRVLKHIEGHKVIVHCTVTRQMTERAGYLDEFVAFWSERPEAEKIWMSLFTPQIGEKSYEILPPAARLRVIEELLELRTKYSKLAMPKKVLQAFVKPPQDPAHCTFARMTRSVTADLHTVITPCQFGGNPDCSQCGCLASAALTAVCEHRLPGGISIGRIFDASLRIGSAVAAMRGDHNYAA
jgi:MoaA/NifB/PqqE/SkfB family radical SAM enzyme